jgi:DNA-binding Lrp family transcriptional regulator
LCVSNKDIAFAVGITPHAAKDRVDKLISNEVIGGFVVLINPAVFGYVKECVLRVKNIDKTIKEQDLFNKISLLGDILFDGKQLEGAAAFFVLFVRTGAEDKMEKLSDILKPAELESIFGRCRPVNVKIHLSDLEIMKCLMSDPRMRVKDIAKETSLSTKTVARRLEKMRENHIFQFTILTDPSSMQLTGFIKLILLINVHPYYHQNIVQRICNEMQEYLLHPLDDSVHYPINYSFSYQNTGEEGVGCKESLLY